MARDRMVGVIQARMRSERLPGKVLRPLGGRPVLSWVVRAAHESGVFADVVVATSTDPSDDDIEAFCAERGVRIVRGSYDDVLDRFLQVVEDCDAPAIVRLTADNPMVDPAVIRATALGFEGGDLDLLSSSHPPSLPIGIGVEAVASAALGRATSLAQDAEREHVTATIYRLPVQFRIAALVYEPRSDDLRVTLDTSNDMEVLQAVATELGDRASSWREVAALLRSRPDLVALNAHVRQKSLEEG